jgi:hypothetical protein
MNDGAWRLKAKYNTVCARCKGYIKIGNWIVKLEGHSRYSHCVCPGMDIPRIPRTVEEMDASETVLTFGTDGQLL